MTQKKASLVRRSVASQPGHEEAQALVLPIEAMWRRVAEETHGAGDGVCAVLACHAALPEDDRSAWCTEDRARAARYSAPERQRAFAAGRLLLHRLLARGAASPLRFNRHGKPSLPGAPCFNLSHTSGHSALATCAAGPIGVDIEYTQRLDNPLSLIDLIAHPNEAGLLRQASPSELPALFLRCWTRKEALLKARGCGLTVPLQAIDTHLDAPAPVISDAQAGWQLRDVALGPLSMALAMPAGVTRVAVFIVQVHDEPSGVRGNACVDDVSSRCFEFPSKISW